MSGLILSVDIGTSSLKAAYIDLDGHLRAFCRVSYARQGLMPAEAAVNVRVWEQSFVLALKNLNIEALGCEIDGICISGNGPTLVPVKSDGEALPPLFWHDKKTLPLPSAAAKSFFLPYAAWFKKNVPLEYKKLRFFVSSHEWLAFRLGALALSVLPQPSYEPYYWDDEQCRLFDLDREKFPPFVKMGEPIGRVSAEAASLFGIKSGIPIIAGGPDFITALIGTGITQAGLVCDRAGSSEGINLCIDVPTEGKGLRVLPHVKQGHWNAGVLIPSSGKLFEWYRTVTAQEGRDYQELMAELIPSSLNTDIFPGDFFFPDSPLPAPCSPLDFGRAVLCTMCFAVRSAVETLAGFFPPIKEMRLSGGQCRNPRWNQLKADITGVSLLVPEIPDGELAGNAVLASLALNPGQTKIHSEETALDDAIARMIRFKEVFKPSSQTAQFWEERYALFKNASNSK